jgi:hypothetical protein
MGSARDEHRAYPVLLLDIGPCHDQRGYDLVIALLTSTSIVKRRPAILGSHAQVECGFAISYANRFVRHETTQHNICDLFLFQQTLSGIVSAHIVCIAVHTAVQC